MGKFNNKELNERHAKDPKLGDYWHEMFNGICVVIEVDLIHVTICKTKRSVGMNEWTWDLSNLDIMTHEEFQRWLSYDTRPGYWADVIPEDHLWAVECAKEIYDAQSTEQV